MAKKKKAKKAPPHKKGPRQEALPGMADRAIQALDDAALSYAEIRDERIQLSQEEGEAKKQLLGLMHAKKKTSYTHGNIHIEIVPEGEKLKVKIKSESSVEDEHVEDVPEPGEDGYEPDVEEDADVVEEEEPEPEEVEELA